MQTKRKILLALLMSSVKSEFVIKRIVKDATANPDEEKWTENVWKDIKDRIRESMAESRQTNGAALYKIHEDKIDAVADKVLCEGATLFVLRNENDRQNAGGGLNLVHGAIYAIHDPLPKFSGSVRISHLVVHRCVFEKGWRERLLNAVLCAYKDTLTGHVRIQCGGSGVPKTEPEPFGGFRSNIFGGVREYVNFFEQNGFQRTNEGLDFMKMDNQILKTVTKITEKVPTEDENSQEENARLKAERKEKKWTKQNQLRENGGFCDQELTTSSEEEESLEDGKEDGVGVQPDMEEDAALEVVSPTDDVNDDGTDPEDNGYGDTVNEKPTDQSPDMSHSMQTEQRIQPVAKQPVVAPQQQQNRRDSAVDNSVTKVGKRSRGGLMLTTPQTDELPAIQEVEPLQDETLNLHKRAEKERQIAKQKAEEIHQSVIQQETVRRAKMEAEKQRKAEKTSQDATVDTPNPLPKPQPRPKQAHNSPQIRQKAPTRSGSPPPPQSVSRPTQPSGLPRTVDDALAKGAAKKVDELSKTSKSKHARKSTQPESRHRVQGSMISEARNISAGKTAAREGDDKNVPSVPKHARKSPQAEPRQHVQGVTSQTHNISGDKTAAPEGDKRGEKNVPSVPKHVRKSPQAEPRQHVQGVTSQTRNISVDKTATPEGDKRGEKNVPSVPKRAKLGNINSTDSKSQYGPMRGRKISSSPKQHGRHATQGRSQAEIDGALLREFAKRRVSRKQQSEKDSSQRISNPNANPMASQPPKGSDNPVGEENPSPEQPKSESKPITDSGHKIQNQTLPADSAPSQNWLSYLKSKWAYLLSIHVPAVVVGWIFFKKNSTSIAEDTTSTVWKSLDNAWSPVRWLSALGLLSVGSYGVYQYLQDEKIPNRSRDSPEPLMSCRKRGMKRGKTQGQTIVIVAVVGLFLIALIICLCLYMRSDDVEYYDIENPPPRI